MAADSWKSQLLLEEGGRRHERGPIVFTSPPATAMATTTTNPRPSSWDYVPPDGPRPRRGGVLRRGEEEALEDGGGPSSSLPSTAFRQQPSSTSHSPPLPPPKNPTIDSRVLLFDLIRLLRFMERRGQDDRIEDENDGGDSNYDDNKNDNDEERRRRRRGQVNRWRIDHLENLWRQLDDHDKSVELRRRIDFVTTKAVVVAPDPQQQDEEGPYDDDPIQRIFFPKKAAVAGDTPKQQQQQPHGSNEQGRPIRSRRPLSSSKPQQAPGVFHEEEEEISDNDVGVGPGPGRVETSSTTTRRSREASDAAVQHLREDQRKQMEEAIATLASQLKQQTQAIHVTLQHQNKNLGGMEDVAERNVDHVQELAKEVTEHVRKGWTTTFTTWVMLIVVAVAFVVTCLVILMIPKRPGACLLFCPRPSPAPSRDAALDPFCHELPDGTRECLTVSEALSRLYSNPPPNDLSTLRSSANDPENVVPNDGGACDDVGGVADASDRRHHDNHPDAQPLECGWEGAGDECASSVETNPSTTHDVASDTLIGGDAETMTDPRRTMVEITAEEQPAVSGDAPDPGRGDSADPSHPVEDETLDPSGGDGTHSDGVAPVAGVADHEGGDNDVAATIETSHPGDESGNVSDPYDVKVVEVDGSGGVAEYASDSVRVDKHVPEPEELSADTNESQDNDDEWELPPIPDADDVLREYMENYRQTESEFLDSDVPQWDEDVDDGVDNDAQHKESDEDDMESEIHHTEDELDFGSSGDDDRDETVSDNGEDDPTEFIEPFTPFDVRNAAAVGDVERLKNYLRSRPDWVNDADRNQWTSLHLAARAGHTEVVKVLLQHGANPALITVSGETPFHIATKRLGLDHPVTALLLETHV